MEVLAKMDTEKAKKAIAAIDKLSSYIAKHAADDVRPGEKATDVAIRWHKELQALARRQVEPDDEPATDWQERVSQCQDILDMLDELPDRCPVDFSESVGEKTRSIMRWIEEHEEVTAAQADALDNMQSGVSRWIE